MKNIRLHIMYDYQCLLRQKYGGISRYFYEIVSRIKANNEIRMPVVGSQNYYFSDQYREHTYNSRIKWFLVRIVNAIYARIYLLVKHNKIQVLHPTYYISYGKWIKKFNIKMVVTVHDMIHELYWSDTNEGGKKNTINNKKRSILNADHIIVVSQNTKEDLLRLYPELSSEKISVIYHGYNNYDSIPVQNMANRYGKYILFVGNRADYKNFGKFIEAIQKIILRDCTIKIICVGGGKFSEDEEDRLNELGIANNFIQISATDDELVNLYRGALCFVFPSLYEGFGIPILEAFSAGCPVILSKSSCFPEIAKDAAVYFDGMDVDDMYEKIFAVINDSDQRRRMVTKGKNRAKDFSWDVAATKTCKIYENLCKE